MAGFMKNLFSGKKVSAKNVWIMMIGLILIAVLIFVLIFFSATIFGTSDVAFEDPTDFTFFVDDHYTSLEVDNDDHEIYVYRASIEDLTAEEIADLTFADFTLDEGKDSGESYDPDLTEYTYYCKINGSDIDEQWFVPELGTNSITVMNSTEDTAMLAYSTDELSSTILNTNYDKWTVQMQTLDAAEGTGVATNKEGFLPYYDYEDDDTKYVVIRIAYNTTSQLSFCDFDSTYDYNERCVSGTNNYTYYEVDATLIGELEFDIQFDSNLGSTYEVLAIAVGYGTADSFTQWDTQA